MYRKRIHAIDILFYLCNLQFPPGLLIFDPPLLGIGTDVVEEEDAAEVEEGSSVALPFEVENSAVLEGRPERGKEV